MIDDGDSLMFDGHGNVCNAHGEIVAAAANRLNAIDSTAEIIDHIPARIATSKDFNEAASPWRPWSESRKVPK